MSKGKEMTVGFLMLLGIVLLGVCTILVQGRAIFSKSQDLMVTFDNTYGLKRGELVMLKGMRIGQVDEQIYKDGQIHVTLQLNTPIKLYEGFKIEIRSSSALGGHVVAIDPGQIMADEVDTSGVLSGIATQDPLSALTDLIEENSQSIREITVALTDVATHIRTGEGTLGKLIYNEEAYDKAISIMDDVKEISSKLVDGEGTIGKLLQEEGIYEDARETFENIQTASEKMNTGDGTIAKLLNDQDLYQDLKALIQNLTSGESTLGKLLNDDTLYSDVAVIAANVREITEDVKAGQGSLGKLLTDEELYNVARDAIKEAGNAVEDFREQAPISSFTSVLFRVFQ